MAGAPEPRYAVEDVGISADIDSDSLELGLAAYDAVYRSTKKAVERPFIP